MWYIITPFKKKCLGKDLPKSVIRHAYKCFLWGTHYEYFLKYAFVSWKEEG